jgi:predicted RND superfamily exporter protein
LLLFRHRFSFMSITAIPLIIGIGIDNGIHLVQRYLRSSSTNNERDGILTIAKASGAALIQSNLTTMVGFGALMASSFAPLAEMGLVTSLGVALALVGGLCLIPAVILLGEQRRLIGIEIATPSPLSSRAEPSFRRSEGFSRGDGPRADLHQYLPSGTGQPANVRIYYCEQ